jgi:predicted metal-binding membrane protein
MSALGHGEPAFGWTIAVVVLSLSAWLGVLVLMGGMDEGPGTPLHDLPVFLVGWVVMLTAMMLPSELNYIGAFAAVLKTRHRASVARPLIMASFVAGYGVAWVAYGLAAYHLDAVLHAVSPEIIARNRGGPFLAGLVLIIAGLYQVSSLKRVCLTGCRTPLAFFARYWREGEFGAVVMGVRHGLVCVGCCWALMAVMFAMDAMSLTWMALLTLFMFAEKVLPKGQTLAIPIACFLSAMGIWIAVSPETAPLLKHQMLYGSSNLPLALTAQMLKHNCWRDGKIIRTYDFLRPARAFSS